MAVSSLALTMLPLVACFLPLLATVGSYLLGAVEKPANTTIPYPSELMIEQPERGVYFVGLGLSATLSMTVILLRYAQIHSFIRNECPIINAVSLLSGILMVIGQLLVPAFTLKEHEIIHYTGAMLYFGAGVIYMILQAHVARKHPYNHTVCIVFVRILLAVLGCIPPSAYTLARILAPIEKQRYYIPQSAEWALCIFIFLFIGTFSWDFSKITMALDSREVKGRNEAGEDVFLTQELSAM